MSVNPFSRHQLKKIKMKNIFSTIAIAGAFMAATPSVVYAQFSMPSIPGMGKSLSGVTLFDGWFYLCYLC